MPKYYEKESDKTFFSVYINKILATLNGKFCNIFLSWKASWNPWKLFGRPKIMVCSMICSQRKRWEDQKNGFCNDMFSDRGNVWRTKDNKVSAECSLVRRSVWPWCNAREINVRYRAACQCSPDNKVFLYSPATVRGFVLFTSGNDSRMKTSTTPERTILFWTK